MRDYCYTDADDETVLLSVIVPAYNEEKTICKTVDSILDRSDFSYEIIVVDDGSTDKTSLNMISMFRLRHKGFIKLRDLRKRSRVVGVWETIRNNVKLYYIEKEKGGKSDALNIGIILCHGRYFMCIDADSLLADKTLDIFGDIIKKHRNIAALGGRVMPKYAFSKSISQKSWNWEHVLLDYQTLEYGIAFHIARPIFDITDTTMLISGAIGAFDRDLVLYLGGYAQDTVAEDMELVMRIRRYAAMHHKNIRIGYLKKAISYTDLPWKLRDLINQRIRWAEGLSEVLREYREVATEKYYTCAEKAAFWYYVLFERFSPHIELAMLIICFVFKFTIGTSLVLIATLLFQCALSIAGSFKPIIASVKRSNNKGNTILKIVVLLMSFVTVYHLFSMVIRLIAVPLYHIKHRSEKGNVSWTSPERR
ncbi:MAG: glycosyltransferase family 2 protein [Lachnospiraceae bacterium]|nr:glycosyltransferase family 2 protein [Lachnospiraceae bacterium]